jgi:outer membrane protein assembly factor BamB
MRRTTRVHGVRHIALTAFAFGVLVATALGQLGSATHAHDRSSATTPSDSWPAYLYDMNHTGYNSAFNAFGTSNAASLTQKWRFATGGSIESNPAVTTITNVTTGACAGITGPIAFIGSWNGYMYAINATTGVQCWKKFLATDVLSPTSTKCLNTLGITSSPTVATVTIGGVSKQVVYVGASDIMFALDAATGQILWHNALAGQGVGTFSASYIWSSPAYSPANSTLYTSTASFCDAQSATIGTVYALDPGTGTVKAKFALQANSPTAPGVWGSPTVDPALGAVFVATGNAFTSTLQQTCTSTPLACAVVELDWNTLAVKSSWQPPSSQAIGDGDFGSTPTLFPGSSGGTWLGVGNKNGFYYVLDTANLAAGPKWEIKMASGGANSIKGIVGPTAYYPGVVGACTGVLYLAAGTTTLNGVTYGGSISALCAATGTILWRQGTTGHCIAAPTIANGLVADEQGGTIELRNWSTGAQLFSFTTGGALHGAATFANGTLYVGSANHYLYAFT